MMLWCVFSCCKSMFDFFTDCVEHTRRADIVVYDANWRLNSAKLFSHTKIADVVEITSNFRFYFVESMSTAGVAFGYLVHYNIVLQFISEMLRSGDDTHHFSFSQHNRKFLVPNNSRKNVFDWRVFQVQTTWALFINKLVSFQNFSIVCVSF